MAPLGCSWCLNNVMPECILYIKVLGRLINLNLYIITLFMYIVAAFIHNIIQRSRERLKKVRKNSFGPLGWDLTHETETLLLYNSIITSLIINSLTWWSNPQPTKVWEYHIYEHFMIFLVTNRFLEPCHDYDDGYRCRFKWS